MEKIDIKDTDLIPSAIILEDSEIITKTCEIYKFKLSDERKCFRLLFTAACCNDFYFDQDENDIDDFDFFLLRIKDDIISILDEKKTEIIFKDCDDDGSDDAYLHVRSLHKLVEYINYYIETHSGKLIMSRENNRDHIYILCGGLESYYLT